MRSAGASLWQLTKPPFSPKWGIPSFVKKEAKGGQNRRGPILSAGGYLPPTRLRRRSVKKCYRHLKFRAVIPARCLTDIRISTDEGAITQAQSDPKRGITPCPSSGRLYVRRIPADPVTFFLWTSGNHASAWFCFYDFIANVLICSCLCGMAGCNFSSILLHITLHVCCNVLICRKIIVASNVTEPFRLLSDGRIISLCKNIVNY